MISSYSYSRIEADNRDLFDGVFFKNFTSTKNSNKNTVYGEFDWDDTYVEYNESVSGYCILFQLVAEELFNKPKLKLRSERI